MRTPTCLLLAATLGATCSGLAVPARAEVRFDGSAEVRLTASPAGPWTSATVADPAVLNPDGDLDGDGAPAVSRADAGWLVAWTSPAHDALRLALANRTWQPTISIDAPGAFGTPVIVRADGAWLVAVRLRDGRIGIAGFTDAGRASELVDVGDGRLVGGRQGELGGQLVVLRQDGSPEVIQFQVVAPDPRPIDVYRDPIGLPPPGSRLPRPGPRPGCPGFRYPFDDQPPTDDAGEDEDGYCARGVGSTRHRLARGRDVGAMLHEVTLEDGRSTGVVTWWPHADRLAFFELADDGPVLPLRTIAIPAVPREDAVATALRAVVTGATR